jgi:hypothetical protein
MEKTMKSHTKVIDRRRLHASRELIGEWRILRAKLRHVVDRTCALAEQVAADDDAVDAIATLRQCVLDYLDGRPFRVAPVEMMRAVGRVLEIDPARTHARAA